MLLFDEVIVPDGKLWKRFGPLHVYAPASGYILALKITAGRQKDLDDCAILLPKTQIRTRKQAQPVLDRYILPEGQQKNAESIENALIARRNIFCNNRLYQNKYEMYEWIQEAIVKDITDVHEIQRYARQKEISLYGA